VTKLVDTDALGIVNRALGLTGAGSQETELLDGILEQVVDVSAMVRRGRTIQPSEGIFYGIFQNVHTEAGALNATINPYRPEIALNTPPYPAVVGAQFDVWILYASMIRVSGTGAVSGSLDALYDGQTQGWGVNNLGAAVVQVPRHPLAIWDSIINIGFDFGVLGSENQPMVKIGTRFPRIGNPDLTFRSEAVARTTITCSVVLGLFPVSLGQDAIVGGL